jgi:FkbM family methyltransferase
MRIHIYADTTIPFLPMDLHDETDFWSHLIDEIISAQPVYYGRENWDAERFGAYKRTSAESLTLLFNRYVRSDVSLLSFDPSTSFDPGIPYNKQYDKIRPWLPGCAKTYTMLADSHSRTLFIKLVAFRMLGFHKVKLPLAINSTDLEKKRDTVRFLIKSAAPEKIMSGTHTLHLVDLRPIGYPVHCYTSECGILTTFILRQYEYRHDGITIAVSPGDYVIDAGGCWGDTGLFFSCATGEGGRVFSFEFDPGNIDVFTRNMAHNTGLSERICITPLALWDTSNERFQYSANGLSTTIAPGYEQRSGKKDLQATTISIDDFVQKNNLKRVDFIKMDIEAAELNALKGAADTIRQFRPTLAIAIYHKTSDFADIPRCISGLTENYSYFIDHFSIHHEETVLFAIPVEKLKR